ncbi:MAG TPA: alpha/beta fold hydrolase [bacterium]|nr:alpha/beta fold hydrolase [bacterium]
MPDITVRGARLHYTDEGPATPRGTILFLHGLLWSGWMFGPQARALSSQWRCIRLDWRGQGKSEVPAGGYDMETLTDEVVAVMDALKTGPCHVVGLSMGGFVAMRLGVRHPERVRSLSLLETSADSEPPENVPKYRRLAFVARWFGLRLVKTPVMKIMFGKTFLADPAREADRAEALRELLSLDVPGMIRALEGVITRAAVYDDLVKITAPTLVVVGEEDVATVPAKAERIAARIPGARLHKVPGAGHTSSWEQPARITELIRAHVEAAAK